MPPQSSIVVRRKTMNLKNKLVLIFVFLICGCLPAPVEFYKPAASSGELINLHCGTAIAPKDTIEFKYDDLQIQITCHSLYLQIFVHIPEGKDAKFISPNIKFLSDNRLTSKTIIISEIKHFDFVSMQYKDFLINDTMLGSERQGMFGKIPVRYEIYADFNEEAPDQFFMQFPSILINGKLYEIPEIEFIKKKGVGIFPVNC